MKAHVAIPKLAVTQTPRRQARVRALSLRIAIALCAALIAAPTAAEVKLRCELSTFGLIDIRDMQQHSMSGVAGRHGTKFTRRTDRIPLQLGTTFGVKTFILGRYPKKETDYQIVWHVPQRTAPDATEPVSTFTIDGNIRLGRALYPWFRFDQEWDLVAGTYRVEVVHDGKPLCAQVFEVSPAYSDVEVTSK